MLPIPPILPYSPGFGYAETHYRFRYGPSFLRKKEPEIIFDAPHRIGPGKRIPVVLLVKDAHLFPVDLEHARIFVHQRDTIVTEQELVHERIRLSAEWWWTIFDVDVGETTGWLSVTIRFTISRNGSTYSYSSNNYRTASHRPLRVYRSSSPLPTYPGFIMGEAHAHSSYTSDQVEYGLPLRPTRYLSAAMGLGFCCITDHSYDLDDRMDSYLINDPGLSKWKAFQNEVDSLNADGTGPVILRGEEVSIRNETGRNVHCLVLGDRTFHPGAGDSAEEWFRTRSELSIGDLASRLSEEAGMFGAHIAEHVPLLQRVLLGRGAWSMRDISSHRLDGVQFWNGTQDDAMERGYQMWVRLLLEGRRTVSIAGNDAHGNFNRFLQLMVPFIALQDSDRQLFGRVRTAAYCKEPTEAGILRALKDGHSVLTDGPMCGIYAKDGRMVIGDTVEYGRSLIIRAESTKEFGRIVSVRLIQGRFGDREEIPIGEWDPSGYAFRSEPLEPGDDASYVRAEVRTEQGDAYGRSHRAITNPVWLSSFL